MLAASAVVVPARQHQTQVKHALGTALAAPHIDVFPAACTRPQVNGLHTYKIASKHRIQIRPHNHVVPPAVAVPVGQPGADVVVHLHQPASQPHVGLLHSKPTIAAQLVAGWALRQARPWHGLGPAATCSHVDRAGDAPSRRPAMEVWKVCRPCTVLGEWGGEVWG